MTRSLKYISLTEEEFRLGKAIVKEYGAHLPGRRISLKRPTGSLEILRQMAERHGASEVRLLQKLRREVRKDEAEAKIAKNLPVSQTSPAPDPTRFVPARSSNGSFKFCPHCGCNLV